MYFLILPFLALICLFVKPIIDYFRDPYDLRKFPSPSCAAFSSIWSAYHSRRLRRSRAIYRAHQRLGPIVRLQPKHVSFAHPQAIQDIYGHRSTIIKDTFYETISGGAHESIVSTRDREEHATKRRYVSNAFSQRNVVSMEPIVNAKVQKLVARLDAAADRGEVLDIREWLNFFTFDVISDMALSYDSNFLGSGQAEMAIQSQDKKQTYTLNPIKAFQDSTVHVASIGHWPKLLAITKPVTKLLNLPYSQSGDQFEDMCVHQLRHRLQQDRHLPPAHADFVENLLVDSHGKARNLPFREVVQEVAVMLSAGSDTSASAMTNALYLLMKHPDVMTQLRTELDAVLGPPRPNNTRPASEAVAAYAKVNNLKYLRACLDESLRILPPASIGLLRQTPPEGATVMGHRLKGGITVSVPTYTIHRDPTLFPDPATFKPERWLSGSTPAERENLKRCVIPFTLGRHACLGRNIAFLEQYVVLATLVQRYDFAFARGGADFELDVVERINANPGCMPVRVRRRGRASGGGS